MGRRDNQWITPDLQRFLLVILQGASLCPLRLSFDKPLISLVHWAVVAVQMDEPEGQARVFINSAHLVEGMHCSLVDPCSLRRVIVWMRSSRIVSVPISVAGAVSVVGRSVKVHVDRVVEWWWSGGDLLAWNDG